MYTFSRVKNRRLSKSKNKLFFSIVALAILPLPPSLQTFIATSTMSSSTKRFFFKSRAQTGFRLQQNH